MASKILNEFVNLFRAMTEGDISYEEFLDLSNPKNPDGIYKDVLGKFEKVIGSQKFANIDKNTQAKILNYYKSIAKTGDAEIIGIKDSFGLDTSALATHRFYLEQGLKPVLDMTKKRDFGSTDALPFAFEQQAIIDHQAPDNPYFTFRLYDDRGVPSELVIKGVKEENPKKPKESKYFFAIPKYGNIIIDKTKSAEESREITIEGVDGNGSELLKEKGILELFPKALKPIVEETQDAISSLKKLYKDSTVSAGGQFDERDSKEFDQWAYENLRKGKEMKDLEDRVFASPQMRINKRRTENMFQAPGMDGTPAASFNGPVPSQPMQSIPPQGTLMTQNPSATGSIQSLPNAAPQGGQAIPSLGPTLNAAVQQSQQATNFRNPMAGAYSFQKNLQSILK